MSMVKKGSYNIMLKCSQTIIDSSGHVQPPLLMGKATFLMFWEEYA